jgi:hypothetical protein
MYSDDMRYTMTIPDEIYRELKEDAGRSTRSMAQEILHRIKSSGVIKEGRVSEVKAISTKRKEWVPEEEKTLGANPMGGLKEEKVELDELIKSGLVKKGVEMGGKKCTECGKELYGSQEGLCYLCGRKAKGFEF